MFEGGTRSWEKVPLTGRNVVRIVSSLTLIAGILLVISVCRADVIAITPGTGGFENDLWNANASIGYDFTLTSSLTVTELGFFDANGASGPTNSHPVGIWNSGRTLLTSATVPSGAPVLLIDGFDFVSISPVVLAPGSYTIGAYGLLTSTDQFEFGESGSITIAGLTLGGAVEAFATGLTFPVAPVDPATQGYFGPNFLATAVPEPSTVTLIAMSFGLIALLRGAILARTLWIGAVGGRTPPSAMGVKISHKLSKARWRRRFRLRFSNIFHHEMFLF